MKSKLQSFGFFLFAMAPFTAKAEVNLRIAIEPGNIIREGSTAKISVSAAGQISSEEPQLKIEGGTLIVRNIGKGFEFMRSNQGVTRVTTYSFEVRGGIGKYNIKGIFKATDGTLYETDNVKLQIRGKTAKEKALSPELVVKVANESPFVGESVFAEITILLQPNTQIYSERNNIVKLSGDSIRAVYLAGPKEAAPVNGKRAIRFLYQISPLKSGNLSLTASFKPLIQLPSTTGRRRVDERFDLKSKPVSIVSRSLPTEGRPADFSGAIGNFALNLQADPLSVKTGEPIAMRFTVTGSGSFEFLEPPKPTSISGWKFYEPTKLDLQRGEPGKPSRLIFSQNIVPEQKHNQLPTFRITVFDSKKEQYVTLITDKIPLKVEEVAISSGFTKKETPSNITATSPQSALSDILMMGNTITPKWSVASTPAWRNSTFWSVNLLSISLLIGAAVWLRFHQKKTNLSGEMSATELLEKLKKNYASGTKFDLIAYDCLRRIISEQNINETSPLLCQVQDRYEYIKFSGNEDKFPEQSTETERSQIIEELNQLTKK
ncbi:MAG: BatD family protein [Verrucomicrobiales bacterium]|nr:BatD family protein [Verrucomicrobiales bacterium]